MGFLEDLVKTIQDAADEARAQQRQRKSSPEWTPVPAPDDQRQRATIVRRHREATTEGASEPSVPTQPAPPSAHRHHAPVGAERLHRLLRQPKTLRELMLLREVLDGPVALRPRHRRWPRR
jgi:hypothetical protein